MTNKCLTAGERPNKILIFISGVRETRAFLTRLRVSCTGGLTAQLKAEKLMVVPSTANCFRATVCALPSLDGREGVSFHTFKLPEDRYARLLVKNLGRGTPESVVREELESGHPCPKSHTAAFRPSRPGPSQGPPSHPSLHPIDVAGASGVQCAFHHRALRTASVGGDVRGPKRPSAIQALPALWTDAA